MAIEYHIRFARSSDGELDGAIRSLPFFRNYDVRYQLYNFRLDGDNSGPGMPDAHAKIEPDGVYFCDNGGPDVTRIKEALIAVGRQFDSTVIIVEL